jgi:hypothetical protein
MPGENGGPKGEKGDWNKKAYRTGWKYLELKGKEDGLDIYELCVGNDKSIWVKLSFMFMAWILEDKPDFKISDLCEASGADLGQYVEWEQSELGKLCKRLDRKLANERMVGQTRVVKKNLIAWVQAGDKKAAEMFLRCTGQYDGDAEAAEGIHAHVVEKYRDGVPVSRKNLEMAKGKMEPNEEEEARLRIKGRFGRGDPATRKSKGRGGFGFGKGDEVLNSEVKTRLDQAEIPRENSGSHISWPKAVQKEMGNG